MVQVPITAGTHHRLHRSQDRFTIHEGTIPLFETYLVSNHTMRAIFLETQVICCDFDGLGNLSDLVELGDLDG